MIQAATDAPHYCEGSARLVIGSGFFRPESRPSRDCSVLLARTLALQRPLRLLDLMAGCGIRSLRCGLESEAALIWANDADPDRLPLLQANLTALPQGVEGRCTALTAQQLLAGCLQRQERFDLVDLDAFGCASALLPLALEAVAFDGVLVLANTDGRSPTGHDRPAAVRRLGAAARAHPASWELALRLQLGTVARSAWALGRGIEPLLSFSEGRTFRTAVRLLRRPRAGEESCLGMLAHCHGCGDQQVQSLLALGRWQPCGCGSSPLPALAVSGPLWIGCLQHPATISAMLEQAALSPQTLAGEGERLLRRLAADPAPTARCWPTEAIARALGLSQPPLAALVTSLRGQGFHAAASAVMAGQLRTDAPWSRILETARAVLAAKAAK
ncbi:MAG: N2,N2-dimethylguanosine tRNA methyltransferase [Cyanobium sp.]